MTTEQRLERLEEVSVQLKETSMQLSNLMTEVVRLVGQQEERIQRQQEQIDEIREDTKMTRRLWVRLATKYGWLDDEDVDGEGG